MNTDHYKSLASILMIVVSICFSHQATANQVPTEVRIKVVRSEDKVPLAKPIIQRVDFEDYIAGVVSKEMPLSWPIEALKAQAVVAKNFALHRINTNLDRAYDLRNDIWDQVYHPTENLKAHQVVRDTMGVILKDSNGKVIQTFFHADCGGQTVPSWSVWPGAKSFGVAADPYCQNRKSNTWKFSVSREELIKLSSPEEFTRASVRAQKFKTKWVSLVGLSINQIRKTFGWDLIRSHPEKLTITMDSVDFEGRGYGHGVGLCQWGAMELAKRGYTFKQILSHYYPRAFIEDKATQLASMERK